MSIYKFSDGGDMAAMIRANSEVDGHVEDACVHYFCFKMSIL